MLGIWLKGNEEAVGGDLDLCDFVESTSIESTFFGVGEREINWDCMRSGAWIKLEESFWKCATNYEF